jgi:hypothetical protein
MGTGGDRSGLRRADLFAALTLKHPLYGLCPPCFAGLENNFIVGMPNNKE